MQRQDRKAREKVAHLPPELRPVLIGIAAMAAKVKNGPRDSEWVEEHVAPLIESYQPLSEIAISAGRNDGGSFALLHAQLVTIRTFVPREGRGPAELAHSARQQTDAAAEAEVLAQALLRKLDGV